MACTAALSSQALQGRHRYTVAQIAAEFGVTRPTIYRYLDQPAKQPKTSTG